MANEPQREIEQDLLAYKQRRREQAGAPIELHPATRKMLQSEAARAASRPLLTSEEAAKNFVRSFVMSHQQPGFFARHKQRVIWGGAMFACLAVVLAVLRNDPRQAEQKRLFTDQLPLAPPASTPQPVRPQSTAAAIKPQAEGESLARDKNVALVADEVKELAKVSGSPVGGPAPANPRGAAVASTPMPAVQREAADRRGGTAFAPAPVASGPVPAPAPAARLAVAKSESALGRALTPDADRKLEEKLAAGEGPQLAKALKAKEADEAKTGSGMKKATGELKSPQNDYFKRVQPVTVAGVAGGAGASPAPAPVAAPATTQLGAYALAEEAPVRQRFLQVDNRAGYRQNFNSPPLPQVMQDFAFERSGDRVRIVDADGSTYEGTVTPVPVEESRTKGAVKLDEAEKRKDADGQSAQAQGANAQLAYRFYARGVNRKLNQSVEFRGEWQPAVPVQTPPATPALQPASLGVRLERQAAEKKERAAIITLSDPLVPTQKSLSQQSQKELPPGRISGRALVGGKSEFDINAVPK